MREKGEPEAGEGKSGERQKLPLQEGDGKKETKAVSRKEDLPQGMGEGLGMACLLERHIIIVRCL